MFAAATLILTVTFTHPALDPKPAELEFPMPDLETCERQGRFFAARSDDTRRFAFVCRRTA